jgi:hypothetical protein
MRRAAVCEAFRSRIQLERGHRTEDTEDTEVFWGGYEGLGEGQPFAKRSGLEFGWRGDIARMTRRFLESTRSVLGPRDTNG